MIEILAAVTGASLSWAAMSSIGRSSRAQSQQEAVVRLTSAVEHIATQLEVMHLDLREERKEFYGRLNSVEQRVSKLEVQPRI
jgi:predicted nucleic acid-binding Zn ribbon protein